MVDIDVTRMPQNVRDAHTASGEQKLRIWLHYKQLRAHQEHGWNAIFNPVKHKEWLKLDADLSYTLAFITLSTMEYVAFTEAYDYVMQRLGIPQKDRKRRVQ